MPRNFKPLTSRAQKLFRKLLDPNPSKRLELVEMTKYIEDRWMRKGVEKAGVKDGQSQLTLGSFQVIFFPSRPSTFKIYLPSFRAFIPTCVRRTVCCTLYYSMVSMTLLLMLPW